MLYAWFPLYVGFLALLVYTKLGCRQRRLALLAFTELEMSPAPVSPPGYRLEMPPAPVSPPGYRLEMPPAPVSPPGYRLEMPPVPVSPPDYRLEMPPAPVSPPGFYQLECRLRRLALLAFTNWNAACVG